MASMFLPLDITRSLLRKTAKPMPQGCEREWESYSCFPLSFYQDMISEVAEREEGLKESRSSRKLQGMEGWPWEKTG